MDIFKLLFRLFTDAHIQSASIYPSSAYKGALPNKTVKKGSKGSDVKAVQTFLNWCIKSGLTVDGICGTKTVKAIKKFQKQYKLKADGIFGAKSKAKAKSIISKYAPKPTPKPSQTWVDKANDWAMKIADDNSWHYVKWSSNPKTHECPICHKHAKGEFHGWNCIGYAWAIWRHGSGIKCKCSCHVIGNDIANKMYKASSANMLAIAKKYSGLSSIKVIRNKKGIPKSEWKAGDICLQFSGSKYVHTFYYMGNGKVADSIGSSGKVANDKQIAVRSYKKYSAKIIIRYTGK